MTPNPSQPIRVKIKFEDKMRRIIEKTNILRRLWNRVKNFWLDIYLNLKVNTANLIRATVVRNTLAKTSSINDISILREFRSPKFKNKNFCPILFNKIKNKIEKITRYLKNLYILIENT